MNRRKRYWILMPPFLLVMLLLFYIIPNPYKGLATIVPLVFWVVLWIWNYIGNEKQKQIER
ncbi:hypothetical protein [Bacillus sinesaloumensis]|uniref:hypothetical protein n=1 Tax=Litchfieldia sinesaloumensis TaxID=1926280 RepID=UPI001151D223|nr:hypothetical protein [Bacillus sinesaloumensis]